MTQAQKVAKEKFKKAIEYRKKFGVSLKEAFAKVYNTKGVQKVAKKVKRKVKSVKKTAKKKIVSSAKKYLGSVKKKSAPKKKISEQSILNKIHVVKKGVDKLDEAQHKHMLGAISKNLVSELNATTDKIHQYELMIYKFQQLIKNYPKDVPQRKEKLKHFKTTVATYKLLLKEYKEHLTQIKKHIK